MIWKFNFFIHPTIAYFSAAGFHNSQLVYVVALAQTELILYETPARYASNFVSNYLVVGFFAIQ